MNDQSRTHAVKAATAVLNARSALETRDVLTILRNVDAANRSLIELAALACEEGVRQGLTQKKMADALGVSPSTLRGLKASVAA